MFAKRLKSRYGKGYQVELKVILASLDDDDVQELLASLSRYKEKPPGGEEEEENTISNSPLFLSLSDAIAAVESLTGDNYLSCKIVETDPVGYVIYKNAKSRQGVSLEDLAVFCATELRLKNLESFFELNFKESVLRERQDTK